MQVELSEQDINDFYSLGKNEDSPIKIEFTTYIKKKYLLKNCHKLKDTNIFITHDLTEKQREEKKLLRKHLRIAKKDTDKSCYIKNNKLHIDDTVLTLEELKNLDKKEVNEESEQIIVPSSQEEETLEKIVDNVKKRKINVKKKHLVK